PPFCCWFSATDCVPSLETTQYVAWVVRSDPLVQRVNTWYWPAFRLCGNGQNTVELPEPALRYRYDDPAAGSVWVCQGPLTWTDGSAFETTSSSACTGNGAPTTISATRICKS